MDWASRIRSAFATAPVLPEPDVLDELTQHARAMYDAARAEGATPEAARRRVDEQIALWARDAASLTRRPRRPPALVPPSAGTSPWVGLAHDLRYAVRLWRRAPAPALAALVTMALGIGATTTLFSATWNVLMTRLPWSNADRLVVLRETRGGSPPRFNSFSNAAYAAWREEAAAVEDVAAWFPRTVTMLDAGEPERVRVVSASGNLFRVLGARPLIGSLFTQRDEHARVIVLSEAVWRQRFGGDAHVLGRVLRLDGEPYSVIGVLSAAQAFPDRQTRAWIPFHVPPPAGGSLSMFEALALLRPGATAAQAAAEGTARGRFAVDSGLTTMAIFGSTGPLEVAAQPLREAVTADVRQPLVVLLAAVVLLLAAATANVANLQLARAATRRREIAIRAAIGAGAARLVRQLLVESVLLGIAGAAAGLAAAWLLHRAVPALLPADFPRLEEVRVTAAVVTFAVALSLVTSVIVGLLPALGARRLNLMEALTDAGAPAIATSGALRSRHARAVMTSAQVAIACVLLVAASLLARSFVALLQADRGFDPASVLTARVTLPSSAYTPERRHAIVDRILTRVAAAPGAVDAAFTSELPVVPGGSTAAFTMRSPHGEQGAVAVQASPRIVSPRVFAALGLRIVEGRGFSDDDNASAPPVVLVNRAFARRYLADAAVGATLPMGVGYGMEHVDATVIGVTDDVRYPGAAEPARPEVYYSFRQMQRRLEIPGVTFLVRTTADPDALGPALRSAIRDADPALAPDTLLSLSDRVSTTLARPRLYAALVGGFALFALLIAAVGLFGVLSYSVAQRSRELGVRAALGAAPADIVRLVLAEGMLLTFAGVVAGVAAALAVAGALRTFLYGVALYDGWTFAGVPLAVLVVAAVACAVPARRAARLDPLTVLRA